MGRARALPALPEPDLPPSPLTPPLCMSKGGSIGAAGSSEKWLASQANVRAIFEQFRTSSEDRQENYAACAYISVHGRDLPEMDNVPAEESAAPAGAAIAENSEA